MKKFAKQNKGFIIQLTQKIDSIPEEGSKILEEEEINEEIESRTTEQEDHSNNFGWPTVTLVLLLLIMGIFCFTGENELTSQCLEEFNRCDCDSRNPVGNLCNELYECLLKEREKMNEQMEEQDQVITEREE